MEMLQFATDVGFPIASACVGLYFVFLTVKFLLDGVQERINGLISIIKQLDTRVTAMSNDIIRIDSLMTDALEIPQEKDKPKLQPVERKD